jgi:phosphoglycerol transferase MdoB-like AlkP superfamily enzyme
MLSLFNRFLKYTPSVLIIKILAVLVLFSISRLNFYFSNLAFFDNIDLDELKRIFQGGIRFDIVSVLYLNLPYILLNIIPGNHHKSALFHKISNLIFFITNAIGLLANCIDATYYQFNLRRSTFTSLTELKDMNNLGELFSSFLIRYWQVWIVWLMFWVALYLIIKVFKPKRNFDDKHSQFDFAFLSVFVIVAGLRGGDLHHATRPLGLNHAGEYVKQANQVALVFNTPFTIFKTLGKQKIQRLAYFDSEKDLDKIYSPIHLPDISKPFKPMNVVVFVIESYSEEASGIYNKDQNTGGFTPFLDSLRLKSFYSDYSFANGKKSIEALPAIWCGVPSLTQPFVLSPFSTNKLNSLPALLKEKGYHTSFFHGAPNGSMGFQSFSNLIGIDHYFGKDEYANDADFDGIWGIWDEEFLCYMEKQVEKFPQPFFSTVFTLSSHDPFKIPSKYKVKFKKGPHPIYETLSYTDLAIKKFFEKARNKPWFKNTIFVFSGDHTSSHATLPEFSNSIGRFRVPIFFYSPNEILNEKSTKNIQQIDVMPSILGLLNYPKPFLAFGKNVFSQSENNFAVNHYGEYQWFSNKFVMQFEGDKPKGLFNFAKDSVLKINLLLQERDIAKKMEQDLKGFLQQYQNRMIDNKLTVK